MPSVRPGPPWTKEERERRERLWTLREAQRLKLSAQKRAAASLAMDAVGEDAHRGQAGPAVATTLTALPSDAQVQQRRPGPLVASPAEKAQDTLVPRPKSQGRGRPVSREERERREEEWILRDVELHVPQDLRSRLACSPPGTASPPREETAEQLDDSSEVLPTPGPQNDSVSDGDEESMPAMSLEEQEELEYVRREVEKARQSVAEGRRPAALASLGTSPLPSQQPEPTPGPSTTETVPSVKEQSRQPLTGEVLTAAREAGISESRIDEVRASLRDAIPDEAMDRELPWILRDIAVGRKLMKS